MPSGKIRGNAQDRFVCAGQPDAVPTAMNLFSKSDSWSTDERLRFPFLGDIL